MKSLSLLEHIEETEIIDIARRLQQHHSFSGKEKAAATEYAEQLEKLGLEVELQEAEPERPNVIAKLAGSGEGPSLMFNGHTDIDPIVSNTASDPFEFKIENGDMLGHGLRNMKAGLASMAAAAGAIARSKIKLKGDLIVAGVVGELQGGIGTTHLLQQGIVPDYAVVPEPTLLNIRTMHAGQVQFVITVIGQSAWIGSLHLHPHQNAVEKMGKIIGALQQLEFSATPHPEIPGLPRKLIGNILGGFTREHILWRPSYVPDCCSLIFEVRTVPGQTIEEITSDLWAAFAPLQAEDPELHIEIEPPPAAYSPPWKGMIAMPPLYLPKDDPLVDIIHRHHLTILGKEPDSIGFFNPGSYACADSGHLQHAGAHVLNYGPSGHGDIRQYGTFGVRVDYLVDCARVLALTAEEILTSSFDQLPGNTLHSKNNSN
jgi:acetylornithine deacetylase/succinyl-diaminopimelate desuccinylase-like protein